jgi:uncharacterized protein YdeI (YjbR/CyaY-like superfamily)
MEITKTLYVSTRSSWRAWLKKHHDSSTEIWLIYYKKNSGKPRIPYNDAVEEALCFGWIDSITKSVDGLKYAQRFTPRKPKSPWSPMNRVRARRLIRAGVMTPTGMRAFKSGVGRISPDKTVHVPSDILSAIKSSPQTWRNFKNFSRSYQRIRVGWIDGARKRPEVFRQRLRYFLQMTEQGKKYGMVR